MSNAQSQRQSQGASSSSKAWSSGLEDVVAAGTRLSSVDGDAGLLLIGGVSLDDLAGVPFVDVAALLQARASGDGPPLVDPSFAARLQTARRSAWGRWRDHEAVLRLRDPMDALRAGLGFVDDDDDDAPALIGSAHALVAAWIAHRSPGTIDDDDDDDVSAGAWLLRRAVGERSPAFGAALDRYLTTVSDHGMNASTFTARVVASTGASRVSCLAAAVGALSGPLHGGAPGPVLDLLDLVRARAAADQLDDDVAAGTVVDDELGAGRRLMGFGHRVYRVRDPRAAVLEATVAALSSPRLKLARVVEGVATARLAALHPERPLRANVEFFTAVLLDAIGLPRSAFAAIFAAARVAGWCAHVVEQRRTGKLIRPRSAWIP